MIYCMFEQSGTFKNEFKKLGMDAIDLDIQNEFGETDRVIDLFAEIEKGYDGKPSVFDEVKQGDTIVAFFPCTRFEAYVPLHARAEMIQAKKWDLEKKLEYSRKIFGEINYMYQLWTKMWLICARGGASAHLRESIWAATHTLSVLPCKAEGNTCRPNALRRLLQEAYSVLVPQLRPEAELLL